MTTASWTKVAVVMAACAVGGTWIGFGSVWAKESAAPPATQPATAPTTRAVDPKPLSDNVDKGLEWLVSHQLPSGAWGQGDEAANVRERRDSSGAPAAPAAAGNVADTCAAVLALMRAGGTPAAGPHATPIRRAADYLCTQVEKSDDTSLYVTDARSTRLQSKLGTYVDTFLAALTLAELKDRMPDEQSHRRVVAALDKTMKKIERNQRPDGGWANEGWAPALAQGVASKAINVAAQRGAAVDETVRKRAEQYAGRNFDAATGAVASAGSAGVELYSRSANLQSLKDSDDTNRTREVALAAQLAAPTTSPAQAQQFRQELSEIKQNREQLAAATQAVVDKVNDPQFMAGFGSNGGEEFLSYMNIGESLVTAGGEEWAKWDKGMTENLNRIQNDDGSWSGHHCITGKTFCTSTALLTLMVDRTTAPVAATMKKR